MKSEILQKVKDKLNNLLKKKEVIDIILFGSILKGKAVPNDIDAAIISDKPFNADIKGIHFSFVKPEEFFIKQPTIVTTLLREGYSLRHRKSFAETLRFESRGLFSYQLAGLKNSNKVRIVNILRGKGKEKEGFVKEYGGEWMGNNIFIAPIEAVYIFERFFTANNIKFKMHYILMH